MCSLQDPNHAVIVLQSVHAGPRQLVLARNQIFVKGLMHVPDETKIDMTGHSASGPKLVSQLALFNYSASTGRGAGRLLLA
jgi:hypothetical protein